MKGIRLLIPVALVALLSGSSVALGANGVGPLGSLGASLSTPNRGASSAENVEADRSIHRPQTPQPRIEQTPEATVAPTVSATTAPTATPTPNHVIPCVLGGSSPLPQCNPCLPRPLQANGILCWPCPPILSADSAIVVKCWPCRWVEAAATSPIACWPCPPISSAAPTSVIPCRPCPWIEAAAQFRCPPLPAAGTLPTPPTPKGRPGA